MSHLRDQLILYGLTAVITVALGMTWVI
jgi:hypothetical protein